MREPRDNAGAYRLTDHRLSVSGWSRGCSEASMRGSERRRSSFMSPRTSFTSDFVSEIVECRASILTLTA